MNCRTPQEAFEAGLKAPCEHGCSPKHTCPDCALRAEESAVLAPLLRPYLSPAAPEREAA